MPSRIRSWYVVILKLLALLSMVGAVVVIVACAYSLNSIRTGRARGNGTEAVTATEHEINIASVGKGFRKMIVGVAAACIIIATCQMISSVNLLLMCSRQFGFRVKLWLACHVFALFVMLTAIFLPLSFNPTTGETLSIGSLGESVMDNTKKTFASSSSLTMDHLKGDLNAYFMALVANSVTILLVIGLNLTSMFCGLADYEEMNSRYGDAANAIVMKESSKLVKPDKYSEERW